MRTQNERKTAHTLVHRRHAKVQARRIERSEHKLPGHPLVIALALAGIVIWLMGVILSNIRIIDQTAGSWGLFG